MRAGRTPIVGAMLMAATWSGTPRLAAAAGPYDGSRTLLCAVSTVMECDGSGGCERHLPDASNAPRFFKIDVAGQTITAEPNKRTTFRSVSHLEGKLIIQGGEHGRGWSATISEDTGTMAAAVVDNDHTFSIFGACTIP